MFGDDAVEGGRNPRWKRRGTARSTVDMDADQFGSGRQLAAGRNHHEMHEVKTLYRAAESPGTNLDPLSLTELDQILCVLFQSKSPCHFAVEVVEIHAQAGKKLPGCLVKEVGIPHDVHVPHLVQVGTFYSGLVLDWQSVQVSLSNQGQRPLLG